MRWGICERRLFPSSCPCVNDPGIRRLGKKGGYVPALLLVSGLLAFSAQAFAAAGDCGQPVSNGARPVATDCLFILRSAVSLQTCEPECICDVNGSGFRATASDALACLRTSIGGEGLLNCRCDREGDDFSDNSKDLTKWGADDTTGNGRLTEEITRLEYRCSPGTTYDESYRPWIKSVLPYDSDWEVQIDVRNISVLDTTGQTSSFGIEIRSPNNDSDYVYAEMYASTREGLPSANGFYGELGFNNGSFASVDTNDLNLTAGAVRIAFDAASKVVTLSYDYPGGDYTWISYGSFGLADSGGDNGNGSWGLIADDVISIFLYGYSDNVEIAIARVYGDNFLVTGAVAP